MRNTSVALAILGLTALVGASGCRVSVSEVPEFVDSSQAAKSTSADWAGQAIDIGNDGVNPAIGESGVQIIVDPSATRVTAKAVFAARAEVEADAQETIRDALATFTLTEDASTIQIRCGHGQKHGTSDAASSGCKLLQVTIPAGSAATPHTLKVGSGNGGITMSGVPVVASLTVDSNGSGSVQASASPVAGASVVVVGDDDVALGLPADFSSKSVTLTVDGSDEKEAAARLVTTDFPGLATGSPWPLSGATENAAASVNVWSKGILSSDTLTIHAL